MNGLPATGPATTFAIPATAIQMIRPVRLVRLAALLTPLACATAPAPAASAQPSLPNVEISSAPALTRGAPSAVGMSNSLVARVDSVINAAIADRATPGATIAVARRGKLLMLKGYGRNDWASSSPAATESTMYDMASLTKVVSATTAAMI